MSRILPALATVLAIGCASSPTPSSSRSGRPNVPVVHEYPHLSQRVQQKREEDQAQAMVGMTQVEGNIR